MYTPYHYEYTAQSNCYTQLVMVANMSFNEIFQSHSFTVEVYFQMYLNGNTLLNVTGWY